MPAGGYAYFVETGATFEVIEDFCNGSTDRLVHALNKLRAGHSLAEIGVFDSVTLNRPGGTRDSRIAHVNEDWFGMRTNRAGKWVSQAKFDAKKNPTTGFWRAWYGDAEKIVRVTLIRAVEVALGLAPDEPIEPGTVPGRHWPVSLLWKSSQPWFEGWVSWQSRAGGQGHVTVLFASPGTGRPVVTSPLAPPERRRPGYEHPPSGCSGERGQWVVTHTAHRAHRDVTSRPTEAGQWVLPTFGPLYEGTGEVVTVSPSEEEGGVQPSGRRYAI